jgi:hypothetical protein
VTNAVVVNANGTIRRSNATIGVTRVALGRYVITWPTDPRTCSLGATISLPAVGVTTPRHGEVNHYGPEGTNLTQATQTEVDTRDDVGGFDDRGFTALEICR